MPGVGSGGTYPIAITANNGSTNAQQRFTLTVDEAPAITSNASTTFKVGTAGSFAVTTSGYPISALSETGALPSGVTFTDNGNGTGLLAGTPGTSGAFPLGITASNGVAPNGSQNFMLTVNPLLAPAVVLGLSPNPVTLGSPITFTATVSGSGGTPTGSIRFFADFQPLGLVPLSGGVATFQTSSLTAGVHSIAASYTGDSNYSLINAVPMTATVTKNPSVVTVGSSGSPAGIGSPVTLTATVSGSDGTPTGTVNFYSNNVMVGQGTLSGGVATLQISTLPGGVDTITAHYTDDGNYAGSVSTNLTQVISKGTTTVALSPLPNPVSAGAQLTLTATVATTLTGVSPTGTVKFFDGYTLLGSGTVTAGVASYQTSALAVGSHSFLAEYSGDGNYSAASGTATDAVAKIATTVAVTSTSNPSPVGQSVTFTATVNIGAGTANPTGTINFYSGNTLMGTGALVGNQATYTTSTLPHGVLTISAQFWGDGNYLGARSPNLTEVVQ
jgi:hypothetical protein